MSHHLPAEVLDMIVSYTLPNWPDHDLWFRLSHASPVLRQCILSHFSKHLIDGAKTLHTRFELHCSGRIIRDRASVTRIEKYLSAPVVLRSAIPARSNGDNAGEVADTTLPTEWENEENQGAWKQVERRFSDWRPVKVVGTWLELETLSVAGHDQDLEERVLLERSVEDASGTEDRMPELYFTCPALALSTADTGKIEFEDVQIKVHSLRLSERETPGGRAWTARVDWREIWAKKMGRERYVQKVQTQKQREWQEKVRANKEAILKARKAKQEESERQSSPMASVPSMKGLSV